MGQLRLAGEIAAAVNGVIAGWLRKIAVTDADHALRITQSGSGDGLRVDVGSDAFRVRSGAVARVPRLELDDDATYLDKDASDNLTLTDVVTGTKTLADLAAGGGGGGGHQIQRVVLSSGYHATSSTSFVDVDSSSLSITMTTGANWVVLGLFGGFFRVTANGGGSGYLDFTIDGDRQGPAGGIYGQAQPTITGQTLGFSLGMLWVVQVDAGEHTFRPQWRLNIGTSISLYHGLGSTPALNFFVAELM
jgi:hypothetical protein